MEVRKSKGLNKIFREAEILQKDLKKLQGSTIEIEENQVARLKSKETAQETPSIKNLKPKVFLKLRKLKMKEILSYFNPEMNLFENLSEK